MHLKCTQQKMEAQEEVELVLEQDGNGGHGANSGVDEGFAGGSAENCGKVNIHNELTVYAYGGAGSSGSPGIHIGSDGKTIVDSGGASGGYPGAGIGRRWSRPEVAETFAHHLVDTLAVEQMEPCIHKIGE